MKRSNMMRLFGVSFVAAVFTLLVGGCTKTADNGATAPFVGNWAGTGCSGNTSVRIDKSNTNYTMTISYMIASDSCQQQVNMLATVSSIDMSNFSMGVQRFIDKCGTQFTLSGGGAITTNDTMLITVYSQSAKTGIQACTFKGYKVL